jgi:opacity protein-like surface antigen
VGVVLDPKLMAFAAAGIAVAKAEAGFFNYIDNDGVTAGDFDIPSSLLTGVTLGGGVEFKPTENLRIRLEGFVDSYPDWKARDETNLGDEQQGEPFVRSSLPLVSEIGSATGRVTVIWQF